MSKIKLLSNDDKNDPVTQKDKESLQFGTIPAGYFGVDTDGDGFIDTLKKGLNNYDKKGMGANEDFYDKTSQMFDYVRRNLIDPVDKDLRNYRKKSMIQRLKGEKENYLFHQNNNI